MKTGILKETFREDRKRIMMNTNGTYRIVQDAWKRLKLRRCVRGWKVFSHSKETNIWGQRYAAKCIACQLKLQTRVCVPNNYGILIPSFILTLCYGGKSINPPCFDHGASSRDTQIPTGFDQGCEAELANGLPCPPDIERRLGYHAGFFGDEIHVDSGISAHVRTIGIFPLHPCSALASDVLWHP